MRAVNEWPHWHHASLQLALSGKYTEGTEDKLCLIESLLSTTNLIQPAQNHLFVYRIVTVDLLSVEVRCVKEKCQVFFSTSLPSTFTSTFTFGIPALVMGVLVFRQSVGRSRNRQLRRGMVLGSQGLWGRAVLRLAWLGLMEGRLSLLVRWVCVMLTPVEIGGWHCSLSR